MSETNNHTQRPHAEFGPSSLKYVAACAGWQSRGGTNASAEMGTRIHEAVEVRNASALHSERELEIYEALVEAEDRWLATVFADVEPEVCKEIQLDIALPFGADTYGTSDLVAVFNDVALVLDYKTGVSEIDDVEANHQSKAYSIGVFQLYPQVKTIHAVFLIPQRNEELHGTYYRTEYDDMRNEIAKIILDGKNVRPKWENGTPEIEELNPNNGCSYCLFQDRCPSLGYVAVEVAKRYAPDLLPSGPIHLSEVSDPAAMSKLYTVAGIVENWAKAVKFACVRNALDGIEIPDYKLRSLGRTRKVTDPKKFIDYAKMCGLDEEELIELADFPVAKVRDLISSRGERGQKKKLAEAFEAGLDEESGVETSDVRMTLQKISSRE